MEYQDKHTEIIVGCAAALRKINENQIESILRIIQRELVNKFPSIEGRDENGPLDWSYDIMNCENDDEVLKTINRIDNIENKSWKCEYCGKDTYEVDSDYLFGFNHIECTMRAEGLEETNEVEDLKKQFDEVVATMRHLQAKIEQLEQKSPKF